jgi:hypothetical protein
MFLTVEDIERLTGYKRKKQQCEQLAAMHIPYRINARNEPIVSEAYINGGSQPKQDRPWQPNLLKLVG